MNLLTSYHGTLGEPLPSPGLSFSTGQARRGGKRETTSRFLIFLKKSSPTSGLRRSSLGTSSRERIPGGSAGPGHVNDVPKASPMG